MKKYKYIFWDMDGTLMDTMPGVRNGVNFAFSELGITVEGYDETRQFIGPPLRTSFPKFLGINDPVKIDELVARFREYYIPYGVYESEPFPGIIETLKVFQDAGYVQAIASSKPEGQVADIAERNNMTQYFDVIAGATLDGKHDKKVLILLDAFDRIKKVHPEFTKDEVVLIGDTHFDVDGAKEAGIDCIGISFGYGTVEEMEEAGAIAIYDSLVDLRNDIMNA